MYNLGIEFKTHTNMLLLFQHMAFTVITTVDIGNSMEEIVCLWVMSCVLWEYGSYGTKLIVCSQM